MIDRIKISFPIYKELVEVFGKEEAYRLILKCDYNILSLNHKLMDEKLIRTFRLREVLK